ncbi:hypothetical protein ACPA9J_22405 [Pseudomonas aeruginosa]
MRERLLAAERVKAIEWRDGTLRLLDQRLLPQEEVWLEHESAAEVAKAIRDMVVRGAPAIGISAAYGIVLGARAPGAGRRLARRAGGGLPPAGRLATHGGQPVLGAEPHGATVWSE